MDGLRGVADLKEKTIDDGFLLTLEFLVEFGGIVGPGMAVWCWRCRDARY